MPSKTMHESDSENRRLIRLMQRINFGRITGLHVHSGRPDFSRPYRAIQTVKLNGCESGPRPETNLADFALCRQQTALLDALACVSDGGCVNVEVRHGLPFLIEIEQDNQVA
ncbi:MAG: hypothetical protein KBG29_01210 [Pseudomonadales bacterium]|nr:hypothetical protein [Pseudomonadales bacterium]